MAQMELTNAEDFIDEVWGKIGTPERDAMEARIKEEMEAHYVGEAIKKARLQQRLSQAELGEKVGVKRSRICRLEKGQCITKTSTFNRIFRALGVTSATIDYTNGGKLKLQY